MQSSPSLAESARPAHPPGVPRWVNWAGGVITALVSLAFVASGAMKLKGGPDLAKAMEPLGLSPDLLVPLGVFEVVCVLLYLAPATSVLAAILFTGYLGGATLAHVRVHEPFVPQMVLGVLVWLGVFFRDYRLRQLIPLRRGKPATP
jgi:uncharacterized membrane protein YphA (DoxX/SURF4 family)